MKPGMLHPRSPQIPGIVDLLNRTMTIGSKTSAIAVVGKVDVAILPDTSDIGFLEWHPDRPRPRGRPVRNP